MRKQTRKNIGDESQTSFSLINLYKPLAIYKRQIYAPFIILYMNLLIFDYYFLCEYFLRKEYIQEKLSKENKMFFMPFKVDNINSNNKCTIIVF